jgi:hypothetical protein
VPRRAQGTAPEPPRAQGTAPEPKPKRRAPVPYAIPRELWTQPAGVIPDDAPLDDYMTLGELTGALRDNSGQLWRWIRHMDRLPFWKARGTRAMFVRRGDAQLWIEEVAALDPERRKTALSITKEMRRLRLLELEAAPLEPLGPAAAPPARLRHRQLVDRRSRRVGCRRPCYAAAPVISAQIAKACARALRYSAAVA